MAGSVISGQRELTEDQLAERAARAATGLAGLGVREGDAVALLLRNDLAFFEASRAAALLNAYAVPLNWHLSADEIAFILHDCSAGVLIVHADLLRPIKTALPPGIALRVVGTPAELAAAYGVAPDLAVVPPGHVDWDTWLASHPPLTDAVPGSSSVILYTSGTTGRPKGVRKFPIPAEDEARNRAMLRTVFGFEPGARTLITGPLYHAAPNIYGLSMAAVGAQVRLAPRFDALALLQAIERHALTHLFLVPTMFVRLLKLPDEVRRRYDVSSLRHVSHAAAPCPVEVKRRMIDWWGPVITEFYGSTETGIVSFCTAEEWLEHPGAVGRALPDSEIRILDDEGQVLPPDAVGEVYGVNRAFNAFTYHGDPAKRAAVERDGLITSGDIGRLDEDGFLFLCDRRNDMVVSGGVNIYPAEVEACLLEIAGVRDCAVFGVPDEDLGEVLAAVVQPEPGIRLRASSISAHVRARLAAYRTPRLITFADDLPREDSGKIFKRRLREPYWAGRGGSL